MTIKLLTILLATLLFTFLSTNQSFAQGIPGSCQQIGWGCDPATGLYCCPGVSCNQTNFKCEQPSTLYETNCWGIATDWDVLDPSRVVVDCKNVCLNGLEGMYINETACRTALTEMQQTIPKPRIPPPAPNSPCTTNNCRTAIGTVDVGTPTGFVRDVFKIILGISGAIGIILLIYAGYVYMTSGGDKQKVLGARETLISALTGLLFVLFSIALLGFIGYNVLGIPGFG